MVLLIKGRAYAITNQRWTRNTPDLDARAGSGARNSSDLTSTSRWTSLLVFVVGATHLDVDGVGVGSSRQEQIKTHREVSGDVGAET